MTHSKISFQDVLQLVELIKSSATFSELRVRSGDVEIDLRRGASVAPSLVVGAFPTPVPTQAEAPAMTAPASSREGASVVTAPMLGTIYLAPEPGAAPFVKVGQQVAPGAQLCIIEVMKLMNAVNAESGGTVTEILAGDGAAVEFGQALFVISAP